MVRVYKGKGADRKSEHLTIPLPVYVIQRLEALAEKMNLPKTEMARRLLLEGLDSKHA